MFQRCINNIKTAFVKQDVRTAGRFDRALRKAESSVLFLFNECSFNFIIGGQGRLAGMVA